jgi:hypothetical protein
MHPFKYSLLPVIVFLMNAFQELYAAVSTGLKKIPRAAGIKAYSRCLLP